MNVSAKRERACSRLVQAASPAEPEQAEKA